MTNKISPEFLEWMNTPKFKEWIYTFTGSWRMRLQYNPNDVDLSWTSKNYDPVVDKLTADEVINHIIASSPFTWRPMKSQLSISVQNGDTTVGQFEGNVRSIRISDIDANHQLKNTLPLYIPRCKPGYELQDQDLLFARSGSVGKTLLFVNERERERERERENSAVCTFDSHLVRARFDQEKMNPKFAFYFTLSYNFKFFVYKSTSTTTIAGVNGSKYANMLMPVPPLETQDKIVTFLDNEVEFIDSIIKRSEALTDRLVEFKGSLITSAVCGEIPVEQLENLYDEQWVNNILSDDELALQINLPQESYLSKAYARNSRGSNFENRLTNYNPVVDQLDSTKALELVRKNSQFNWLRLQGLTRKNLGNGVNYTGDLSEVIRLIKVADIDNNREISADTKHFYFDKAPIEQHLQHGDVLITNAGSVGKSFYFDAEKYPEIYTFYKNWTRIQVDSEKLLPKFFYYFTLTANYSNWISSVNTVTTLPYINISNFSQMEVPVPNLETQKRIIDFLDKKITQIDNLIAKLTELKNLQSEYRLSLISHAVTGMIDVDEFSAEHASNWEARKRHLESQEEIVATQRQKRGKALRINSMEKEKSYGEIFPWWEIAIQYF